MAPHYSKPVSQGQTTRHHVPDASLSKSELNLLGKNGKNFTSEERVRIALLQLRFAAKAHITSSSFKGRLKVLLLPVVTALLRRTAITSGINEHQKPTSTKSSPGGEQDNGREGSFAYNYSASSGEDTESIFSLLWDSVGELFHALKILAKAVLSEVKEAAAELSWFFFRKCVDLLELLCDLRGKRSKEHNGASPETTNAPPTPLAQMIFACFVALISGMLYFAFSEYCRLLAASPILLRASGIRNINSLRIVFHILFGLGAVAYAKGVVTDPGYVAEEDPHECAKWKSELHALREAHERKRTVYTEVEAEKLREDLLEVGLREDEESKNLLHLVRRGGGVIAKGASATTSASTTSYSEVARLAGLRFCQEERIFKPDRAHFCRVANKNIMRMDHHCPWLLNTVGLKNHKFFYLFVLYSTLTCDLLALLLSPSALAATTGGAAKLLGGAKLAAAATMIPSSSWLVLTQGAVLSSVLAAAMNPFLVLHTYLMCKNMTTLEFFEKYWGADEEAKPKVEDENSTTALEGEGRANRNNQEDRRDRVVRLHDTRGGLDLSVASSRRTTTAGGAVEHSSTSFAADFLLGSTAAMGVPLLSLGDVDDEEKKTSLQEQSHQPTTRRTNIKNPNPYDLGIFSNIAQVMGTHNVLVWPLPFVNSYNERAEQIGYRYPRNDDEDREDKQKRVREGSSSSLSSKNKNYNMMMPFSFYPGGEGEEGDQEQDSLSRGLDLHDEDNSSTLWVPTSDGRGRMAHVGRRSLVAPGQDEDDSEDDDHDQYVEQELEQDHEKQLQLHQMLNKKSSLPDTKTALYLVENSTTTRTGTKARPAPPRLSSKQMRRPPIRPNRNRSRTTANLNKSRNNQSSAGLEEKPDPDTSVNMYYNQSSLLGEEDSDEEDEEEQFGAQSRHLPASHCAILETSITTPRDFIFTRISKEQKKKAGEQEKTRHSRSTSARAKRGGASKPVREDPSDDEASATPAMSEQALAWIGDKVDDVMVGGEYLWDMLTRF
ncbi:unnamed protein product [Amoebophrya sp. A25]|nr:unnamed protein product [Amoebophrya sp. A25]|eukprot:GSA25T00001635001.1